jgi:hypothetical protein
MDFNKQQAMRAAAEERDYANRARTAAAHGQDASFYEAQRDAVRNELSADASREVTIAAMREGRHSYLADR